MATPKAASVELDWVDSFLADRELRPNTKKAYSRQLRQFQCWLEFKHWANVDENDLSRYKTYLKEKPTRGGKFGLAAASINQALATIQSFFKWLAIRRFINFNPALTLEMVTLAPPKPKDLEVETVQQLADGLPYRGQLSVRDTAILGLLKHGLRATEVSKANIGDFRDQAIRIEDAKWGSDGIVPLAP
ncbi:MAG: site-specific integrase, partial [Cyanobacteria bacterium J06635_15]